MDSSELEILKVIIEKEEGEKSILNNIIDLMPFKMHVAGCKFCGPRIKLTERLEPGDVEVNTIDEVCREHDIAYADKKTMSHCRADRILAEKTFCRVLAGETPPDERTIAMMIACCMVSKITCVKYFSPIKKAIKCRETKKSKMYKKSTKKQAREKKKKNV